MRNNEVILGIEGLRPPLRVGAETPRNITPLPTSENFNLDIFYQNEINDLEISRCHIEANVWKPVLDRIAKVERFRTVISTPLSLPVNLKENQFQLITGKIFNELYKFEAQVCGVKNIESFEKLSNYIESNTVKHDKAYVDLKKDTTIQNKQKIILKWQDKGWYSNEDLSCIDYSTREVTFYKNKKFRIGFENIPNLVKFVTKDNNPVEITKNLSKLGIEIDQYAFWSGNYIKSLKNLYSAPYAGEVIKNAQAISYWKNDRYDYLDLTETVNLLTKIAHNPNYKTEFSVEKNKKINLLSKGLLADVGEKEYSYLSTIVENPDYLEFTAYIINLCKQYSYDYVPILENLKFLDENNFIKPILELNRLGISLEKIDSYQFGNVDYPSLKSLFDNDVNRNKDINVVRQEVGEYLKKSLQNPEIINLLNNSQNKDFVGLISHIRGYPVTIDDLSVINKLFGNNLEKKQNAILVLKSICKKDKINEDYSIKFIYETSLNTNFVNALKNPEFISFFDKFKSLGVTLSQFDISFIDSSKVLDVFNNPILKEGLKKESTQKIIKLFKGNFNLNNCEYYINLGNNPKAIKIIKCLDKYGINPFYGLDGEQEMINFLSKNEEAFKKFNSVEVRKFAKRLNKEFRWNLEISEIIDFIKFYENGDLQKKLFDAKNYDYIKKVMPSGFSFVSLDKWLNLDESKRQLMLDLISKINFYPESDPNKVENNFEIINLLSTDINFKNKLFSKKIIEKFKLLRSNFGVSVYDINHLTSVIQTSDEFIPFVTEFSNKYRYAFDYNDVAILNDLSKNKQQFFDLLDLLNLQGYRFKTGDIYEIATLLPFIDRIPETLKNLKDVLSYNFKITDCEYIVFAVNQDCSVSELTDIKNIFEKYKEKPSDEFKIKLLKDVRLIKNNELVITKLEENKYKFSINNLGKIRGLLEYQDKDSVFDGFNLLNKYYQLSFNPEYFLDYSKFIKIQDIDSKINDVITLFPYSILIHSHNFKIYTSLKGDLNLYNKSIDILGNEYFKNIRDARNRIDKFIKKISDREISDDEIAKIFNLSTKATELDQISHKYLIALEISKGVEVLDWHSQFLQTQNINQANKFLTKSIVNLSIPLIYSNLESSLLESKKKELTNTASKNNNFGEILEINCRALGIYKQKYKTGSKGFNELSKAIQIAIELNLESDSNNTYHQKRIDLSKHQFERIFEGISEDKKSEIMGKWMDLSTKNNISTTGGIVTEQEDTITRLNNIREIVRNDLSIHLGQLIFTKINNFENENNVNRIYEINEDQVKIYKEFLIAGGGQIPQDIPILYRKVKNIIRDYQQIIKGGYQSSEDLSSLGKKIGTYQGVADCLKSIYKLGSISEENYKMKIGYVNQIDNYSGKFSSALKKLKLLDVERLSTDVNVRALENEVLYDFEKLKTTLIEENISQQTVFQIESVDNFLDLAKAPEMTGSCQRLTEITGFNHAAYSRILDGSNEMINVSEIKNGYKNRVARSFIELSKIKIAQDSDPQLAVLVDRLYTNSQYYSFGMNFSIKMIDHLIDRFIDQPEISILFGQDTFPLNSKAVSQIESRGYKINKVSGEYFINESNVKLSKYYDSLGGENNVVLPHWKKFNSFYLIEKN